MVYLDFETRSRVVLKEVGLWNYVLHPSTEIILADWLIGSESVTTLSMEDTVKYAKQLSAKLTIKAHNAAFEYAVWFAILHKRYGVPMPSISRFRCTMAKALTHGLPASLGGCARALELEYEKDKEGAALMLKMTTPNSKTGVFRDSVEDRQRLGRYCQQDNKVAKAIDERLADLTPTEHLVWCIDRTMNVQGFLIDTELAKIACEVAEDFKKQANARCEKITGGLVSSLTQVSALKDYCKYERGVRLDSFDKPALIKLLNNPKTDPIVRELCILRQAVGRSSVTKYQTALGLADESGLLRESLQYHAAITGRWGGRGLQPQNLPRTIIKDMPTFVEDIKYDFYLGKRDKEIMNKLSSCLRGLIIAREGHKFLIADYAQIEARVLMWFAGEDEAVKMFREGSDIYIEMAKRIFRREDLTKSQNVFERNVGKETVLGCGYGMGVHKFNTICDTKNIDLGVKDQLDFKKNLVSMLAVQCIGSYREEYKQVVYLWAVLDSAFRECLRNGIAKTYGLTFLMEKGFLSIKLLSGRKLYYYGAKFKPQEGYSQPSICYRSCGDNGQLEDTLTHGGTLTANVISAMSRDIMAQALVKVYKAGYNPILTVHDEIICEIKKDDPRTVDDMINILIEVPKWAKGCPINAEGLESERYCK